MNDIDQMHHKEFPFKSTHKDQLVNRWRSITVDRFEKKTRKIKACTGQEEKETSHELYLHHLTKSEVTRAGMPVLPVHTFETNSPNSSVVLALAKPFSSSWLPSGLNGLSWVYRLISGAAKFPFPYIRFFHFAYSYFLKRAHPLADKRCF